MQTKSRVACYMQLVDCVTGFSHGCGDQKIIRLLLDNDTRLILDPIMRSVSELSLDEIFGTLMNN